MKKKKSKNNIVKKVEKQPKQRKYSEIFVEFMKPYTLNIDSEVELDKTYKFGQIMWNKAVSEAFPENLTSIELENIYYLFLTTFDDKNLISEFLERKNKFFKDYNFFILKLNITLLYYGNSKVDIGVLLLEKE